MPASMRSPCNKSTFFNVQSIEKRGGLNENTDIHAVPQCLGAEALSKFLDKLVTLRKNFTKQRILMSKADV